jgi:hypothetical protein
MALPTSGPYRLTAGSTLYHYLWSIFLTRVIEYGSALYCVHTPATGNGTAEDDGSDPTPVSIRVGKSTNGGATWEIITGGPDLALRSDDYMKSRTFDACLSDGKIYVSYCSTSKHVSIACLDLSDDTWSILSEDGPDLTASMSYTASWFSSDNWLQTRITAQPEGRFVVAFQSLTEPIDGNEHETLSIVSWDGEVWGVDAQLVPPGGDGYNVLINLCSIGSEAYVLLASYEQYYGTSLGASLCQFSSSDVAEEPAVISDALVGNLAHGVFGVVSLGDKLYIACAEIDESITVDDGNQPFTWVVYQGPPGGLVRTLVCPNEGAAAQSAQSLGDTPCGLAVRSSGCAFLWYQPFDRSYNLTPSLYLSTKTLSATEWGSSTLYTDLDYGENGVVLYGAMSLSALSADRLIMQGKGTFDGDENLNFLVFSAGGGAGCAYAAYGSAGRKRQMQ